MTGDFSKDLTNMIQTPAGKAIMDKAIADGWIGLGFDYESPLINRYNYGYMRGYSWSQPSFEIDYITYEPGCLIPVFVNNVPPVINASNITVSPTEVFEGQNITVSNFSFYDPGNDTYEYNIKLGEYESGWLPLGEMPVPGTGGTGIVINEVNTGGSDWVELYNYGSDRDLTGWKLYCDEYPSQGLTTYTFPSFTLKSKSFVQIHETSGTNDADDLYIGSNIYWNNGGPGSAVSLCDASNNCYDFVSWNSYTGLVPVDAWSGSLTQGTSNDNIYRFTDTDTDSASDWKLGPESGVTPKQRNPGQTGQSAGGGGGGKDIETYVPNDHETTLGTGWNVYPWGSNSARRYMNWYNGGQFGGKKQNIKEIGFRVGNYVFKASYTNLDIYLSHLTTSFSSTFASNYGTGRTKVFSSSSFTWSAASNDVWLMIPLDTTFAYDGSSNVVLEVAYTSRIQSGTVAVNYDNDATNLKRLWASSPTATTGRLSTSTGLVTKFVGSGGSAGSEGWGVYGPGYHFVNMSLNMTAFDDHPVSGTSQDELNVTVMVRDDDDHKLIPETGIGPTMEGPKTIHPTSSTSNYYNGRKLVMRGSTLYAVVQNYQSPNYNILLAKSTDGGDNWEYTRVNDEPYFTSGQYYPTLAIDSTGVLHVAWRGYASSGSATSYNIRYACSRDDGKTWGERYNASTGYGYQLAMTVDQNDKIHIAFTGYQTSSPYKVFYLNRSASGVWGNRKMVSESNVYCYDPAIDVDTKGNAHIVWRGYRSSSITYYAIRHRMFTAATGKWSQIINLTAYTSSTDYHYAPSIACDKQDNAHVVWYGRDSVVTTNYNVRYMKFDGSTQKWGSMEYITRITPSNPYQYWPSIAVNNESKIDVVWSGYQSPNWNSPYIIHHATKVGTTWEVDWNFYVGSGYQYYPNLMHSWNSLPKKGYAFV
jgi:hypothetical protein